MSVLPPAPRGRARRMAGTRTADRAMALTAAVTAALTVALTVALSVAVSGCAAPGGSGAAATPARATDTAASGQPADAAALQARLAQADIVLLGEQHDNREHHALRGTWLTTLAATPGRQPVVVAEHLSRGLRVNAAAGALLPALQGAGFDAAAWDWPMHQPLFAPLLAAGLPLWGGNLPRDEARRIAREGDSAWPPDLAALLRQAPLAAAAQARLDATLRDSHCGMLPPARVPAMRAAQRARDAAMAQALLAAHAQGARPAVLLAGNGHVRNDYGVAQLLAVLAPQLRVLSVSLVEPGPAGDADAAATDLHWTTNAAPRREDPCAAMRAGTHATTPATPPAAAASR